MPFCDFLLPPAVYLLKHCLSWPPDLHPAPGDCPQCAALLEIFSDDRKRVRQGRAVLNCHDTESPGR